jgi:hypothetical protein
MAFSGAPLLLLGETPSFSVEQPLRERYRPGTIVVVQQEGVLAIPAPGEWLCNSYSQGNRVRQSTKCAVSYSANKDQTRSLHIGEKAYLTATQIKPSEVVFSVQTCVRDNEVPFKAILSVQFPKGYLFSMKLETIQGTINHVFALDAGRSVQKPDLAQHYAPQGVQQDPLQHRLSSEFVLTQTTAYMTDIVSEGTRLVLQKGGLTMNPVAVGQVRLNTYKNGKISQGWNSVRDKTGIGGCDVFSAAVNAGRFCAIRQFGVHEAVWVTGIEIQKNGIILQLYSQPYDGVRYFGLLKFPFDEGSAPTPDEAMATIAEVLTAERGGGGAKMTQVSTPPNQPAGSHATTQTTTDLRTTVAEQPTPSALPLKVPSTWVNTQTQTDELQLNADKSFSLQEAGQSYHGTFVVNGNTMELSISETKDKATATLQGSNLTDSSGQIWVLRERSAAGVPSGRAVLQNQDVIKMAKAGFDDEIILAKIGSSKSEFDTSTDALIRLKESGVSATVMRAVLGAGKQ